LLSSSLTLKTKSRDAPSGGAGREPTGIRGFSYEQKKRWTAQVAVIAGSCLA
jgi:hypothetical protein